MDILSALILLILIVLLVWIFAVRCRKGNAALPTLQQYRYAHRGLHDADKPENSLAAFKAAVAHGYGAELDVHVTADDKLVVFHDSNTKRICGQEMVIEQSTLEQLRSLRLCGTEEYIPELHEVLALFENTTPLVVELKTVGGNAAHLCEKVFELLDGYKGVYCVESFDPRVLQWLKANRPDVCRGQLAAKFGKGSAGIPGYQRFALSHLLTGCVTTPDFIAYDHTTRKKTTSLNICRGVWGVQEVSWTVRSEADMHQLEKLGNLVIFENFTP